MILHRITVQGFGPLSDPVTVPGREEADLGPGVVVLHGPNETGKSSLLLALARGLFDRYRTKGDEMLRHRPWGTSLSPRIEIEFSVRGTRYRLEKRFLEGAGSELGEWRGERYGRLAEGEDADLRVRDLLAAPGSGKGASRIEHWGLARVLWLVQDPDRSRLPGTDDALRGHLTRVLGGAALSVPEKTLIERLEQEAAAHFTGKKVQAKKGSLLPELDARIAELEAQIAAASSRLEAAEKAAGAVEAAELALVGLEEEAAGIRDRIEAVERARTEEESVARTLLEKQKDRERLAERHAELVREREDRRARAQAIRDQETRREELAPRLARATLRAGETAAALGAAEEDERARQQDEERARAADLQARGLAQVAALADEAARLAGLEARRSALEEERAQVERRLEVEACPEPRQLAEAEALETAYTEARARHQAEALELRFTAGAERHRLRFESSGTTREAEAAPGTPVAFLGEARARLAIEGVGTLEVSAGAGAAGAVRAREALERAAEARVALLARFRVSDLAALRTLVQVGQERRRALETLATRISELLPEDLGDRSRWADRRSRVDEELAKLRARLGLDPEAALERPLPDQIERTASAAEAAARAVKEAAKAVKARRKERDQAEAERSSLEQEGGAIAARLAALVEEADRARRTRGEDAALEAQASELASQVALAEDAVRGLESKLPPVEERADRRRQRLDASLESVGKALSARREELAADRRSLEETAAGNVRSALVAAEEELERVRSRRALEGARVGALRLLAETARALGEETERSLVAPVEGEVRRLLAHLAGGDPGWRLALSPDLAQAALHRAGEDLAGGGWEELSWGAREQAVLVLRLALGRLLSRQEGHPWLVVLDDPLVNTDRIRADRALELLEVYGRELQILVLTAFPERYREVASREVDLAALRRGSSR